MSRRLMTIAMILAVLLVLLLAVAWFDGGQEPQRLIVEEVTLPEPQP